MSAIIDVNEVKEAKCVQWKIPQFFQTLKDVQTYKSQITIFQKECTLYLYSGGTYGATPNIIEVSLFMLHPDLKFTPHLIIDSEGFGDEIFSKSEDGDNDEGHFKSWSWIYATIESQTQLPDEDLRGRLIISCKEEISDSFSTAVASCQAEFPRNTVCRNFQDLLLSGRKSDASIEVQGQLFEVHKLILEAYSPVFTDLFDRATSEKNRCIVKVDDCDPDTFQNFLKCLYSGKLKNTSPDSLMCLYKLSDKYCVSDLKEKCSEFMVNELCEDTVFEVLAVADMCNDAQLKASAGTFLIKNIKTILRTETWKKLQSENPSLAADILTKVYVEDFS